MKANGSIIEQERIKLGVSKEVLCARVQQELGVDLKYRQYEKIMSNGYLPTRKGKAIIQALAKIFNCPTESLIVQNKDAA